MKSLACLLLSTLLCHAAFAAEEFLPGLFAGTFHGEVFNGDDLDPVVMTIELDAAGRMRGAYEVDEEQGVYRGRLSNFRFIDARTLEMEWTDKFGEGYALMEFSADFSSFVGGWSPSEESRLLPWNGRRQGN